MREIPPPFSDVVTKKNAIAFIIQGELPGAEDDVPKPEQDASSVAEVSVGDAATKIEKDDKGNVKVTKPRTRLSYSLLMLLASLSSTVQMKLDTLRFDGMNKAQKGEVTRFIDMVGRIYGQPNIKSLMKCYRNELPVFFGFKNASVMFHDADKDQLYAITFGDEEDRKLNVAEKRAAALNDGDRELIDITETMRQLMIGHTEMILFPTSNGITGNVFKKQKTILFNNFTRRNNIQFSNDVDNIDSLDHIKNLAVVPLKRDDGSSNGVLYLYNHPDGISNVMRHKLDGIGAYLGTMIQNLEDKKIRVT